MAKKAFDNEDRKRYYGLRVGDIVTNGFTETHAEVVFYGIMNNNRVKLKYPDGSIGSASAEHCTIIQKVEDRISIKIAYSCVCKTVEERDLFVNFIAEMKKLKEMNHDKN